MATALFNHLINVSKYQKTDFRLANLRKIIKKHMKEGSVLDVGCGTGHMTLEALQNGHQVTSIDISKEMVNITKDLASKNGFNVDVKIMDVKDIKNLGKETFDNVVCLDMLYYVEDDIEILENFRYVLKNKGILLLTVPALKHLHGIRDKDYEHRRRYSKIELIKKVRSSGFSYITIRYWNFLGVFPTLFFEKILHKKICERFRYSRKSILEKFLNGLLNIYFYYVENRISFPIGLTLIVIAVAKKKRDED